MRTLLRSPVHPCWACGIGLLALATLTAAALPTMAHAQMPTTGGVALGMTQAEVKDAMGADVTPHLSERPLGDFVGNAPAGSPNLQVIFAETRDTAKRYTVFFLNDKAVVVGFREMLQPDAVPTLENLQSALVKKYGPMTNSSGPMFHWAFNADGSLISDDTDDANGCYGKYLDKIHPVAGPGYPETDGIPPADGSTVSNSIGCSMAIFAWAGPGTYTAWLLNEQVFTDAYEAAKTATANARGARLRAQEQVEPHL